VSADVWGLISDVHGNLTALEEAVRVLEAAGATRLAFLGDYLGRGDSDGCVRCIRGLADVAVVGNRDLDWQDRVALETKEWVLGLPRQAQAGELVVAHGDARLTPEFSTAQIGRGFPRAFAAMQARQATVLAFGHSHHARTWRKQLADSLPELLDTTVLEPGWRYFLNVGTTGLPFPGKGPPSVALLDLAHGRLEHVRLAWWAGSQLGRSTILGTHGRS
jgi:predicted phosphodiesterase